MTFVCAFTGPSCLQLFTACTHILVSFWVGAWGAGGSGGHTTSDCRPPAMEQTSTGLQLYICMLACPHWHFFSFVSLLVCCSPALSAGATSLLELAASASRAPSCTVLHQSACMAHSACWLPTACCKECRAALSSLPHLLQCHHHLKSSFLPFFSGLMPACCCHGLVLSQHHLSIRVVSL